jgi:hypothetical protein
MRCQLQLRSLQYQTWMHVGGHLPEELQLWEQCQVVRHTNSANPDTTGTPDTSPCTTYPGVSRHLPREEWWIRRASLRVRLRRQLQLRGVQHQAGLHVGGPVPRYVQRRQERKVVWSSSCSSSARPPRTAARAARCVEHRR